MWCMVPQPFATGGNQLYPEFWVVISSPRYPRYFTSIVATKPFVEQAVKNVLSTGGIIGAHTLLWALSAGFGGEVVGLKPPRYRPGIPQWCPPCSPEATSGVKAQAEAKFLMYCLV
jgi:hypothetical protein